MHLAQGKDERGKSHHTTLNHPQS